MSPLIVLDCHYLCHRAYHSTGGLSHNGSATGVIFGFLKSIESLKREFMSDRIAFCFEGRRLFRRELYPDYKIKRRGGQDEMRRDEMERRAEFTQQIRRLRKRYLPDIGFKNVFYLQGYEADDIMAQLSYQFGVHDEKVILVTADSDLLQCLRPNVSVYNPQKQFLATHIWFKEKYGIPPHWWADVKAMAGCSSDNVQGISGIGEISALRFLRDELPEKSAAYRKIIEGFNITKRNRKLVKLPFKGFPPLPIVDDKLSEKGWRQVCSELGMRSLAGRLPQLRRAVR